MKEYVTRPVKRFAASIVNVEVIRTDSLYSLYKITLDDDRVFNCDSDCTLNRMPENGDYYVIDPDIGFCWVESKMRFEMRHERVLEKT